MSAAKPRGQVVDTYCDYFKTLKDYHRSEDWQKDFLLRGALLKKCNTIEPVNMRHRLRRFWVQQMTLRGLNTQELQTWS